MQAAQSSHIQIPQSNVRVLGYNNRHKTHWWNSTANQSYKWYAIYKLRYTSELYAKNTRENTIRTRTHSSILQIYRRRKITSYTLRDFHISIEPVRNFPRQRWKSYTEEMCCDELKRTHALISPTLCSFSIFHIESERRCRSARKTNIIWKLLSEILQSKVSTRLVRHARFYLIVYIYFPLASAKFANNRFPIDE